MKIIKITLFLLCLSFSATAKDSTTVEFKRFAIGIHASPDYCYRKLKVISPTAQTGSIVAIREEKELPSLGFTGGAALSFYIKKQIAISLGINFSQKAYKTAPYDLVDPNGIAAGNVEFRYTYNYIEIPLKANFLIGKKKIRFISSIGATSSFLLYQQTISKQSFSDGTKEIRKGKPNYIYNPFNLFVNGSVGVDCKLGKKMGLRIEPTYSYGLFQTIDSYITEHLWNAGLKIGCYILL